MKKHYLIPLFILHSSFFTFLCAQTISTVAGNYSYGPGYSGDGGQATAAELNSPEGVAVDRSGNIFIADDANNLIRKVAYSTGVISTVAGSFNGGTGGYNGDGGPATAAELHGPSGVAVDTSGNIFIADAANNVIRKVDYTTGNISTVAGNYAYGAGYSGDGGPATAAELNNPAGITVDTLGNIFIADAANNVIRKVDHSSGNISTVAGNHSYGYNGDGGPATAAEINFPTSVAVDTAGNIYIADYNNQVIRKVDYSSGNISTVAGNHVFGYSGDGGPATAAELDYPWGITADKKGNLFIADEFNNLIRGVFYSNGNIGTIAGNFNGGIGGYSGDRGPATAAELRGPTGTALDASDNLYIADENNNVIRRVTSVAALGIDEVTPLSTLVNVYPNPNNGIFTLSCHSEHSEESLSIIQVYNVLGENVLTETLLRQPAQQGDNIINLIGRPNGIYFYRVITENGDLLGEGKVIIQK